MAEQYLPALVTFCLAGGLVATFAVLGKLLGPQRSTPLKGDAFECGNPPSGSARERFPVRFYLTAILFIVFDVEVVFLYPWAVVFQQFKLFGLAAMGTFLIILLVGYFYAWKKGGLEWE